MSTSTRSPETEPESSGSGACKVTKCSDSAVNTDLTCADIESLERELSEVKCQLQQSEQDQHDLKERQLFRLKHISDDDAKVRFCTGFSTLSAFLGPSVNHLKYWSRTSETDQVKSSSGRKRILSPLEEIFLVLVRLRLGLFEQDLAYRFGVSQSTISRIVITWINLLYLQFKQIPLWPPKALIVSNMPKEFKKTIHL